MTDISKHLKRMLFTCTVTILIGIVGWYCYFAIHYGQVSLQWNANKEADLAGYKIYYGTSSKSYTESIIVGLANESQQGIVTYKLSRLEKYQTYFIAVTAYNLYGTESPFSNEVEAFAQ
jgi:hypothetical protein